MKNQFFYTIVHTIANNAPNRANDEPIETRTIASFNMDKVIRSMEIPSGELIVILDDFHNEVQQNNTVNPNTNKLIIGKKETVVVQSEIKLSVEDKGRFFSLTNIEN
jgi:hypothetical protein